MHGFTFVLRRRRAILTDGTPLLMGAPHISSQIEWDSTVN